MGNRAPGEYARAEVVQVIKVVYPRGKGSDGDAFRRVTAFFTMDGELIAEQDPVDAWLAELTEEYRP